MISFVAVEDSARLLKEGQQDLIPSHSGHTPFGPQASQIPQIDGINGFVLMAPPPNVLHWRNLPRLLHKAYCKYDVGFFFSWGGVLFSQDLFGPLPYLLHPSALRPASINNSFFGRQILHHVDLPFLAMRPTKTSFLDQKHPTLRLLQLTPLDDI